MSVRKILRATLLATTITVFAGCQNVPVLHNLQPHRLQMWNRQPAPSRDPYFSLRDNPRLDRVGLTVS